MIEKLDINRWAHFLDNYWMISVSFVKYMSTVIFNFQNFFVKY